MLLRVLSCIMLLLLGCGKENESKVGAGSLLSLCPRVIDSTPPAVTGAQCGKLLVLENPENPTGKKISLNVLRWPAISPVPELDPVFVIAGGPGQSAVTIAPMLATVFFDLRKDRDIVFVDQRGTGQSSPMHCNAEVEDIKFPFLKTSSSALLEDKKALAVCAETFKEQAIYYTTPYAVMDLEEVRKTLGYHKINLWGASYGTRVILEYLSQYSDSLRAVVMDGVAPVQLALPAFIEADAYASLEKIAKNCASRPICESQYGDILAKAKDTSLRLKNAPKRLSIAHPLTEAATEILIDQEKYAALLRFALYDRTLAKLLPRVISTAYEGNYQLLASLVTQLFTNDALQSIARGMHINILCNEDEGYKFSPRNPRFFGLNSKLAMINACEVWPSFSMAERYYEPVSSNVPALLLSGAMDPVTPPRWADSAMQGLTQSLHVVALGAHHGVTLQGCAAKVVTQFIQNASIATLDVSCIEAIAPLAPFTGVQYHD